VTAAARKKFDGGLTGLSTTSTPRKFDSVSQRNSTAPGSSPDTGLETPGFGLVNITDDKAEANTAAYVRSREAESNKHWLAGGDHAPVDSACSREHTFAWDENSRQTVNGDVYPLSKHSNDANTNRKKLSAHTQQPTLKAALFDWEQMMLD